MATLTKQQPFTRQQVEQQINEDLEAGYLIPGISDGNRSVRIDFYGLFHLADALVNPIYWHSMASANLAYSLSGQLRISRTNSFSAASVPTHESIAIPTAKAQLDQEARLEAILNTAVEAIIVIDQRGLCESMNPAAEEMFGYADEEVIGKNISMLMPSPYREEHDGYVQNYLQTGHKKIIGIGREVTGLRKSGEAFPINLAVSEVQLPDRIIFAGFIQDISEQKEAQSRLVQSERLAVLGEAMARLAHESRNSLQRIQIAVETARLHSQDGTPLSGQLDAIEKASDGLDSLLTELKNYAAPLTLDTIDACLVGIWREAWQATAPLRVGRTVELRELISEARIACSVDRFRMEQVFRNLFENSLAACTDPVQIAICVSQTHGEMGGLWEVRVSDNGPGLSPQQASRIFEPFFTTKSKGTGLGMAIASRIVEAHRGKMMVGHPETGTEIVILLPQ